MSRALAGLALLCAVPLAATEREEAGLRMLADRYEAALAQSAKNIDDPELTAYLHATACPDEGPSCRDVRIHVLREPGFNAFMMPNGAMFVQSGLLLRTSHEDELAAVLNHELSHYDRKHSLERFRNVRRTTSIAAFLSVGVSSLQGATALAALTAMAAYSRSQERQADIDSLRRMADHGRETMRALRVWEKVIAEHDAAGASGGGFLASHPAPRKRMRYLSKQAQAYGATGAESAAQPDPNFIDRFAQYRKDWLTDEIRTAHPKQFAVVAATQRAVGFSAGLSLYMEAKSWLHHGRRADAGKRAAYVGEALAALERGAQAADPMPAEAYRDWGKALMRSKRGAGVAQDKFRQYLNLAPNAKDADVITRLIDRVN